MIKHMFILLLFSLNLQAQAPIYVCYMQIMDSLDHPILIPIDSTPVAYQAEYMYDAGIVKDTIGVYDFIYINKKGNLKITSGLVIEEGHKYVDQSGLVTKYYPVQQYAIKRGIFNKRYYFNNEIVDEDEYTQIVYNTTKKKGCRIYKLLNKHD